MLSRRSIRNLETQIQIFNKRNLDNDIYDMKEFMSLYLREENGVVYRKIGVMDSGISSNCVSYNILSSYPEDIYRPNAVRVEKKTDVLVEEEIVELRKETFLLEKPLQQLQVLTSEPVSGDRFFSLQGDRYFAKIERGTMYTPQAKIALFSKEHPTYVVEMWGEKIHDLIQEGEEYCVNKPFSYRRMILEDSVFKNMLTIEVDLPNHNDICVKDTQYHFGGIGLYFVVIEKTEYRLRSGQAGWLAMGTGAGGDKLVVVKYYDNGECFREGDYLLDEDFVPRGFSTWIYHRDDFFFVRGNRFDVRSVVTRINSPVVEEENGQEVLAIYSGNVIDVGMRYEIWRYCKLYDCEGTVCNVGSVVELRVKIPLRHVDKVRMYLGTLTIGYEAELTWEIKGIVKLSRIRRFFIIREMFSLKS